MTLGARPHRRGARGDPDRQPDHHAAVLRRRLGDARRAGAAFVAYAPAHLARGIVQRHRPVPRLRDRDGRRRRDPDRALRRCSPRSASRPPGRTASPSRCRPLVGVVVGRRRAASCAPSPGPQADVAARSPRTSAGCCSARCSPPASSTPARSPPTCSPDEGETRPGHPVRLRRAAGPHPAVPVPGRAGRAAPPPVAARRRAASSTSSAAGSAG